MPNNRRGYTAPKNQKVPWIKDWLKTIRPTLPTFSLGTELPLSFLLRFFWIAFLGVIYIYFQHRHDNLIREVIVKRKEMEEVRASYITQQARFMYDSKQSEVRKRLEDAKLSTNLEPPTKIQVP
ncbi:MAG: FtsL-like putative cell division protein [Spirosomataceae bacterium]